MKPDPPKTVTSPLSCSIAGIDTSAFQFGQSIFRLSYRLGRELYSRFGAVVVSGVQGAARGSSIPGGTPDDRARARN
jgi:hypothetical protein